MNNKGFTLVELISVIVILVSVSLVAVGGVSESLERRDRKECEEQVELAINAAKIYFSLENETEVTVLELKNGNYFTSNKKIDRLRNSDTITFGVNDYVYTGSSCVVMDPVEPIEPVVPPSPVVPPEEPVVMTYDYKINEIFDNSKYLTTGYVVDWDKDFSIETNIKISSGGKRYLIIGNYNNSDLKEINIEINASNQLRLYLAQGGLDNTFGTVMVGEVVKVKFDWSASSDMYTISAIGTNTNISSSGSYSMSGKSVNSLRVGTVDYRGNSTTFNPITVSGLKISTKENINSSLVIPNSAKDGIEFLGWSSSSTDNSVSHFAGDTYVVTENKVFYAVWTVVKPVLDVGMIPIIIKDDGTVITISSTSSEWFNYEQKKWANVVLVKENGSKSRSYYKNNVGVVIPENDILAYYVWIPRYKYKIWTLSKNTNVGNEQTIDIVFEHSTAPATTGSSIGDYVTHPAFIWGGSRVAGIWVGKFETGHTTVYSGGTQMSCADTNCADADGLFIKHNVASIHSNRIGKYFYVSKSMTRDGNPFGLNASTTDSHITKNTEWGAIAYLADSKYGINGKIRVNNTFGSSLKTGCGAASDTEIDDVDECKLKYGSGVSSYPQSTTGNISGIFDMSGGRAEYVMANYNSTLKTSDLGSFPDSKYYNLIPSDPDDCTLDTCGGMGVWETHGWYGAGGEQMVSSSYPWQYRGGKKSDSTNATVGIYSYFYTTGTWANYITYRSVLTVQ